MEHPLLVMDPLLTVLSCKFTIPILACIILIEQTSCSGSTSYFLVPDDIYETFPLQTYRTTRGTKIQHVSPELEERVEQWALRMPMSLEEYMEK